MMVTWTAGWVYAPCRRAGIGADGLSYPHHGQWGRSIALSFSGGALRARASLMRLDEDGQDGIPPECL